MKLMKIMGVLVVALLAIMVFAGCEAEATVASRNLSQAADQFEVFRRVVFVNGITNEYILQIEGYCSVEFYTDKFVVTVKTEDGTFLKHYLGRADNVFPFVEQLTPEAVSTARYRVIFRPSLIIPDIDLE